MRNISKMNRENVENVLRFSQVEGKERQQVPDIFFFLLKTEGRFVNISYAPRWCVAYDVWMCAAVCAMRASLWRLPPMKNESLPTSSAPVSSPLSYRLFQRRSLSSASPPTKLERCQWCSSKKTPVTWNAGNLEHEALLQNSSRSQDLLHLQNTERLCQNRSWRFYVRNCKKI